MNTRCNNVYNNNDIIIMYMNIKKRNILFNMKSNYSHFFVMHTIEEREAPLQAFLSLSLTTLDEISPTGIWIKTILVK